MRTHISEYHLSVLSKKFELKRLFITYGLVSVALAFVGAFGPIYLFRSGYSIRNILMFFLVVSLVKFLILPIVFRFMNVIGSNKMMSIGIFFFIISFILFATPSNNIWHLWLLAIVKAIGNARYYASYRVNFTIAHTKKDTGKQASYIHSIISMFSIFAPLAGGVLSFYFSVSAVYIAATLLFIIAAIIIWLTPQHFIKKINFNNIPKGKALKDYGSNFSYSFSCLADMFVWPILVSLIIPSYVGIGAIGTLFTFLSIFTALYVGRKVDSDANRLKFLGFGVGFEFVHSLGRLFAATIPHLIGLGLLKSISGSMLSISYDKRYYNNALGGNWLEYLFAQEIANTLPWMIYFPILLISSFYLSSNNLLYLGVILTIPFIFGILMINNKK